MRACETTSASYELASYVEQNTQLQNIVLLLVSTVKWQKFKVLEVEAQYPVPVDASAFSTAQHKACDVGKDRKCQYKVLAVKGMDLLIKERPRPRTRSDRKTRKCTSSASLQRLQIMNDSLLM